MMKLDPLSRRRFAENTAKAMLGLSLVPAVDRAIAAAPQGKAKHLIYLYMGGGMTHIDTFDPKPGSETQGNTGVISTNVDGIQLGEHFQKLSKMADKIAIVNSLNQKTGAHDQGRYWMLTGYQQKATIVHPELGPWMQKINGKMSEQLPHSFIIGGGGQPGAGFMGPSYAPLPIGDPTRGLPNSMSPAEGSREKKRLEALDTFNRSFTSKFQSDDVKAYTEFYDNTMEFLQSEDLEVFDLAKEKQETRDLFGNSRLGQAALLATRLIEKGAGYVRLNSGGWDMHNNIDQALTGRVGELDNTLAALLITLEAKGLLKDTVIAIGTEFGRTPNINANAGRDHHPRCFSGMIAGGPIVGGQKFGKTDAKGYAVEEDPCSPEDFNATIAMALGIPLDKLVFSPSGRPFLVAGHTLDPKTKEIVPDGKPIMKFFS
jgi:hypothetical protein